MNFSKLDQTGNVKIPKKIYYLLIDYFLLGNRQAETEHKIMAALENKVDAQARREEYGRKIQKRDGEG